MDDRLRVASIQYYIRPVRSFAEFAEQVSALVSTAADYKARLVVFPEYFTVQLLTLAVPGFDRHDAPRDLDAVGADVLDWRRPHQARNEREVLETG